MRLVRSLSPHLAPLGALLLLACRTSDGPSGVPASDGDVTVGDASDSDVIATAAPSAAFTFSPTSPAVHQTVQFDDHTTGLPASWFWTFGDGATSTVQYPSHTFETAGTYAVTLAATNTFGSSRAAHSVTVAAAPTAMAAQFSFTLSGVTVSFTDTSTGGPKVWAWDFGDGTTCSLENPTHTFAPAGTYTVGLTVGTSAAPTTSSVKQVVIVSAAAPVAAFSYSRASNAATIDFVDGSAGSPTSWAWSFGDGATSAEQSPSHAYAAPGTYTASLTASNAQGATQVSHTFSVSPVSNLLDAQIPGGQFDMGDHFGFVDPAHPSDEVPVHTVTIRSLYVATTTTTNRQFADFLTSALAAGSIRVQNGTVTASDGVTLFAYLHDSAPASGGASAAYSIGYDATAKAFSVVDFRANHPVVGITWFGAAAYTNWLSQQAGLTPCFDPASWICDFTKSGYRLPTEAEWEYAARGGQTDPYLNYPWGDDADVAQANWPSSGDPYEGTDPSTYPWTTPVGFYNGQLRRKSDYGWPAGATEYQTHVGANAYGLFDMAGNVWQFVYDWYSAAYYQQCAASSPTVDPTGPTTGQDIGGGTVVRGMRGGNWFNGEIDANVNNGHSRVSNRCPAAPTFFAVPAPAFSTNVGMRVVRRN